MRALCWFGPNDVRIEQVPDPELINPGDAIIRVTTTAICGSDLHILQGFIPGMQNGDILGHEFMGEVVEVGKSVTSLKRGDRVVVPFAIACGNCQYCQQKLWALCDNTNPNSQVAEKLYGSSGAGLFGYSHIFGGYAGGQAEYVRVPYADVGPIKVPEHLSDEQVLFLSDIFPTGYMAAENCAIRPGDVIAVWGCGPVGQFAIKSALMLGAGLVIAIDSIPERLEMAAKQPGVQTLNYNKVNVLTELHHMTAGRGPDACIDAVGMESHGHDPMAMIDKVKHTLKLETDRPSALRLAIQACRKGGRISIPGVYGGIVDSFPLGAIFNKGLTLTGGQTHMQRYLKPLLTRIEQGEIDPSFVITHRLTLDEAPAGYQIFQQKKDECIKVVLKPGAL